jgi:hypothetical protein
METIAITFSCITLSTKDTLELLASYLTLFGVFIAVFGFIISLRSSYFATMEKCTGEYRIIVRKIQAGKSPKAVSSKDSIDDEILRKDMAGLFNEQLFYIRKGYISREISLEWMTTIYQNLKNIPPNDRLSFKPEIWDPFSRVRHFMDLIGVVEKENGEDTYDQNDVSTLVRKVYRRYYQRPWAARAWASLFKG